jgi:hypothetical protein
MLCSFPFEASPFDSKIIQRDFFFAEPSEVAELGDAPDLGFTVIPSVGNSYIDNITRCDALDVVVRGS